MSRAAAHLISLQREDGCWEGEVVWCTMILSQYVIVRHAMGRSVPDATRERILRHYEATRTADGGWPLHPEGPAQVFTTTLAYVALRLLGVDPDGELAAPARAWLRRQPEGVLGIPTWGKFWLSLLDLYGAEGVGALPPELFVLPTWLPGHPCGWYCHTRYIYLGMSYLSARGFRAELGPLRDALRRELYDAPYESIDFAAHRYCVSPVDLHAKPSFAFSVLRRTVPLLAALIPRSVRARALRVCFEKILDEQRASRYQALSPVNGLLNCLAIHATDPAHPDLESSVTGLEAWRWCDHERGIRYAGARAQVWDTAFAARALQSWVVNRESTIDASLRASLRKAHQYLRQAQLCEELPPLDVARGGPEPVEGPDRAAQDRESIRGGWCFSDGAHRWPVSDCAAEALTAIVAIEAAPDLVPEADRMPRERVREAVEFLLSRQNGDGGFSTYEPARCGTWLDRLNPSEMFRDCMTERSYVECTASAVEALAAVRRAHPDLMPGALARAIERGVTFLRRSQRADGTFPAAWGISSTYSIFHAVKALRAAGVEAGDPVLIRAAAWLRSTQHDDGGWGEHFSSCLEGRYVPHPRSQAVMTSWALLALAEIDPDCDAARAGLAWLKAAEQADGSWRRDAVNGVFFGTAMLEYCLYTAYFPTWALGRVKSEG